MEVAWLFTVRPIPESRFLFGTGRWSISLKGWYELELEVGLDKYSMLEGARIASMKTKNKQQIKGNAKESMKRN
jgi:hypothetical protein